MNIFKTQKLFRSTDFKEASTLMYFGFPILNVDEKMTGKCKTMEFEDTPELRKCLLDYVNGVLRVDPHKLFQMQNAVHTVSKRDFR